MDQKPRDTRPPLGVNDRLAYERTYLAYERTQMGWVRTALSLISFGFTIAKFFEYMHESRSETAPMFEARTVGILMIGGGLAALLLADLQHRRAIKILRSQCPDLPPSMAGITGAFIALVGILALVGAIIRH